MSASRALPRPFTLASVAAVALFVGAYSNSLRNAFHFDDDHVVERNLHLRSLANIPGFFADAHTFSSLTQNAAYRPLVTTTLAIDYALGGLNPLPYHLTQLLLFLGVGVLLCWLTFEVLRRSGGEQPWHRWAALFAGAFFCLHTANTQPGNYISARSELLCALGILGAFFVYVRAPKLRRYHLYLLPMVLGALAKPPAVVFGPLLFAFVFLFEEDAAALPLLPRLRRSLWRSAPALLVGAAIFVFVERMAPPGMSYGGGDRAQYLWTQAFVWLRYARLFFWPTGLSADTDLGLLPTWQDGRVYAGVAFFAATGVVALWAMTRPALRPVSFGLAWYWVGILPTSVVPLAEVTNDHRMFLGYLGAAMALATALFTAARLAPRHPALTPAFAATLCAVLGALAVGTFVRNRAWATEETLWADVVQKSPHNGRGLMNYGLTQMRKGKLLEAKALFDRAAALTPHYAVLEVNQGVVTAALGEPAQAEAHFLRALALSPDFAAAHAYYGRFLGERGRAPDALVELEKARELARSDPFARHLLLDLLAARGDEARTLEVARETLALGADREAEARLRGVPPFAAATDDGQGWFARGLELAAAGRHARAAEAYRMALRREPGRADAWNNLGWSLQSLGFMPEARGAYERALQLDPQLAHARNNLAALR